MNLSYIITTISSVDMLTIVITIIVIFLFSIPGRYKFYKLNKTTKNLQDVVKKLKSNQESHSEQISKLKSEVFFDNVTVDDKLNDLNSQNHDINNLQELKNNHEGERLEKQRKKYVDNLENESEDTKANIKASIEEIDLRLRQLEKEREYIEDLESILEYCKMGDKQIKAAEILKEEWGLK